MAIQDEKHDEGFLNVACYIKDNHLYLDFGKNVSWLSLHKSHVRDLIDNLEKQYKRLEPKDQLDTGINKVKDIEEHKFGQTTFEVTLKNEAGEIIYQSKTPGGVFVGVEKILDISGGTIEAQQQVLGWGPILVQWHGFEMLRKYFRQNMERFLDEAIKMGGIHATPETIEMLKKSFRENTKP